MVPRSPTRSLSRRGPRAVRCTREPGPRPPRSPAGSWLDLLSGLLFVQDLPSGAAVHRLPYRQLPCFGVVALIYQAPYLAAGIAEPSEGAEFLHVVQDEAGTIEDLGLPCKGLARGRLLPVEAYLRVRVVAEGLGLRLATSAQRVAR